MSSRYWPFPDAFQSLCILLELTDTRWSECYREYVDKISRCNLDGDRGQFASARRNYRDRCTAVEIEERVGRILLLSVKRPDWASDGDEGFHAERCRAGRERELTRTETVVEASTSFLMLTK